MHRLIKLQVTIICLRIYLVSKFHWLLQERNPRVNYFFLYFVIIYILKDYLIYFFLWLPNVTRYTTFKWLKIFFFRVPVSVEIIHHLKNTIKTNNYFYNFIKTKTYIFLLLFMITKFSWKTWWSWKQKM